VYTPPHYRNRGYAAACVAALSKRLLDSGRKFCALFADAENPISNGIYRKIGYRDVYIYDKLHFD
jgi:predicted GNAT family acetyltransferase